MARSDTPTSPFEGYQRIRGRGLLQRMARSRDIILLGDGEIVHIQTEGYTERCRRIRLRDVHALVIRPTRSGKWVNIILGMVSAGLIWAVIACASDPGLQIFWSVFLIFALLFLALNALLGATCTAQIVTAVQTITLSQVGRMRVAQHLFDMLRPAIAESQGYAVVAQEEMLSTEEPYTNDVPETTDWGEAGEQVRDFT